MYQEFAKGLLERYAFLSSRDSADCWSCFCPTDNLVELASALRGREGFEMLVDLTALDWGQENSPRFTTLYHLNRITTNIPSLTLYLREGIKIRRKTAF